MLIEYRLKADLWNAAYILNQFKIICQGKVAIMLVCVPNSPTPTPKGRKNNSVISTNVKFKA